MKLFLALGSNRGDRAANLAAARAALERGGVHVLRSSGNRLTEPEAATSRRRFLNCVLEAETDLLPGVLMGRLQRLERDSGRHRTPGRRNRPRTLDLDLILYGRGRLRTPKLEVPHPRFRRRRFVLEPLAELAPQLRPAGCRHTIAQLAHRARGG